MSKESIHRNISYVKSVMRLAGYLLLLPSVPVAVAVLFASEVLGIAEEVFGA